MLMSFWVNSEQAYLQCISLCNYVISYFGPFLLNGDTDLLLIFYKCFFSEPLLSVLKSRCFLNFSLNFFGFISQTIAWNCFQFTVNVPSVDPYLVCLNRTATKIFGMELLVILCQYLPIL